MTTENLEGVSSTSILLARTRAEITKHPELGRVFKDPLSVKMTDPLPEEDLECDKETRYLFQCEVLFRTLLIDEWLELHLKSGAYQQVVFLASGLETRSFRLQCLEGVKVFEVDQPPVVDFVSKALRGETPKARRISVKADLTEADWHEKLIKEGFSPDQRTLWLLEGLLMYVNLEDTKNLIFTVWDNSTHDSRVIAQFLADGELKEDDERLKMIKGELEKKEAFLQLMGLTSEDYKSLFQEQGFECEGIISTKNIPLREPLLKEKSKILEEFRKLEESKRTLATTKFFVGCVKKGPTSEFA